LIQRVIHAISENTKLFPINTLVKNRNNSASIVNGKFQGTWY